MRIATIEHQGRPRVGRLSQDQQTIEFFGADGSRGALELIERGTLPLSGETVALAGVRLLAPFPKPRRNLFCVGRN